MRGHGDLRLVAALALLCAALALLIPLTGVAAIFAVPLTLLLPGYAIAAAAFARRKLEWALFFVLSVALSLAILILGSLLLNYVGGIHPLSWAVLLVVVTFAACWTAALRRGPGDRGPRWPRPRLGALGATLLLGGAVAAIAAIVLSASTVPSGDALGYTQLWILPQAGTKGHEAQVGVRSQQQTSLDYDLRIRIGEDEVVKRSFRLAPGETHVVHVRAPSDSAGVVPVIATLLRHNRPTSVYRRVKGSLVAPQEPR
jgi:Protein of unknown function (DUF1616)